MQLRTDFRPEASGRSDVVGVDPPDMQHRGQSLNGSYILRTVNAVSDTTLKSLSPVSPNQPDSCDRRHGQKTHFDCHQFDCTCRIVTTLFAASVDVTEAVLNCQRKYSGRSHRGELAYRVAGLGLSNRGISRCEKSSSATPAGIAFFLALKGEQ